MIADPLTPVVAMALYTDILRERSRRTPGQHGCPYLFVKGASRAPDASTCVSAIHAFLANIGGEVWWEYAISAGSIADGEFHAGASDPIALSAALRSARCELVGL